MYRLHSLSFRPLAVLANGFIFAILLAACDGENVAEAPAEPVTVAPVAVAVEEPPRGEELADEPAPVTPGAEPAVDTSIREAAEFGDDALLRGLAPDGWQQSGEIEHYNVATLYDKIDGRSELYMSYDVVGLSWVSFVNASDNSQFIDVFVYDMRSPTGAFGIYSVEREQGQEKLPYGRETYLTGSNYFFWKGRHYGYIQSSLDAEPNRAAGLSILETLMERIPDDGGPVIGVEHVPAEGMVDDTLQYFRADAMSLDFMTDTYTARYLIDGREVTVFMSRRASEEEAQSVFDKYVAYMQDYGDGLETVDMGGTMMAVADLGGGYYDAAFRHGVTVAGVSAVKDKEIAKVAAEKFKNKLDADD